MGALQPADFGNPRAMERASIAFVRALHGEAMRPAEGIKLPVDFRRLLSMKPVLRIMELRACGYDNGEIADVLGYKDARSVRSQIVRYRIQVRRAHNG